MILNLQFKYRAQQPYCLYMYSYSLDSCCKRELFKKSLFYCLNVHSYIGSTFPFGSSLVLYVKYFEVLFVCLSFSFFCDIIFVYRFWSRRLLHTGLVSLCVVIDVDNCVGVVGFFVCLCVWYSLFHVSVFSLSCVCAFCQECYNGVLSETISLFFMVGCLHFFLEVLP